MSLLLKALKQAEQGSGKPAAGDENLDIEPMDTPFSVRREWVQPNDNEADPGLAPKRSVRLALPRLGLVPATALIALLVALGYGIYVYLAISRPGVVAVPAAPPQAARPSQPTEPAPPGQPAMIAPEQMARAPDSARPMSSLPGAPPSREASVPIMETAPGKSRAPARRTQTVPPPAHAALPTLQGTIPPAELETAYQAYQKGDLETARQIYGRVASRDRNPDALLGLAAIAMVQGRPAEGVRLYQQVLDVDPRNAIAQAALLDALGTTDSVAAEAQLKAQIQQAPSAYLHYALGNLYADQKRWSDAEAAYFEAFKREPANGDYAFNLAVSLDHLRQPEAALRHYESALKLAGPDSRFKRSQAETRIQQLKGQ